LSAVTAALQSYADRGVFRGFRATPGPGGRVDYQFVWLTRKPMSATFDPRTRSLKFPALFPGIDKTSASDLKALIAARGLRDQPAHKRIDARRARLTGSVRRGDFGLSIVIRGRNDEYAVKQALNVINELFVSLHERDPEYLAAQFHVSTE
jgi:hypothetical protein